MDTKAKARYRAKARIIKAVAHPRRLFIVDRLAKGERCVCDLTAMVGDDVSTISRHLSVLKGAEIISDEKRGTQVSYSLQVPCALNFFSFVESVLKNDATRRSALGG